MNCLVNINFLPMSYGSSFLYSTLAKCCAKPKVQVEQFNILRMLGEGWSLMYSTQGYSQMRAIISTDQQSAAGNN